MKTHITLTKYGSNKIFIDTRCVHVLEELSPDSEGNLGLRTLIYYRMPEAVLEFIVEESIEEIKELEKQMKEFNYQEELYYTQERARTRHGKEDQIYSRPNRES